MATAQHVYEEHDSVDDNLLHRISDDVFYLKLTFLARDLGIPEAEIQRIDELKEPKERTFKVCIFYFVLTEQFSISTVTFFIKFDMTNLSKMAIFIDFNGNLDYFCCKYS